MALERRSIDRETTEMLLALDSYRRSGNYHLAHNCGLPGMQALRAPGVPLSRLPGRAGTLGRAAYLPAMRPKDAVIHLWNKIPIADVGPWGVTFESRLPRLPDEDPALRRFVARLMGPNKPRFVLAMSHYAKRRACASLAAHGTGDAPVVDVVYPRVTGTPTEIPILSRSDPLTMTFVGSDFFRKGGEAILDFIEQSPRANVHVNIVSSIEVGGYATPWKRHDDRSLTIERLRANNNVTWWPSLPHSHVMRLMRSSAAVLLPSLADTFGYSLAEGAVCGALPVATRIQALPEILGDEGHRIDLEIDQHDEWSGIGKGPTAYRPALDRIVDSISGFVDEARSEPRAFAARRRATMLRAQGVFGDQRDRHLERVYRGAGIDVRRANSNEP